MENIHRKITNGILSVPKAMYGCCNWGNRDDYKKYLVSTVVTKFVWNALPLDDENHFQYIYTTISIKLIDKIYNGL